MSEGSGEGVGSGVACTAGGTTVAAGPDAAAGARAGRGVVGRVPAGVGAGIGIGWTIGAGAGVGAGAGRGVGVWPDGARSKSRTGGVMTVGAVLFCAAAGVARSRTGISAVVARRENAVTRCALA